MKPFIVSAATIVVLLALLLIGVWSGIYDFAAASPHTKLVTMLIGLARERSLEERASDVKVPSLGDPAMIRECAEHYDAMCVSCHLAPGMRDNEMRPGMNPKPPLLAAAPPEPPPGSSGLLNTVSK